MKNARFVQTCAAMTAGLLASSIAEADSVDISLGAPPARAINLTAEGTTGWAYWGLNGPASKDEKAGLSEFTPVFPYHMGPTLAQGTGSRMSFNFSDGSPDASATDARTFIYDADVNGPRGPQFGLVLKAPVEVVKVYAVTHNAVGAMVVEINGTGAMNAIVSPLPVTNGDGMGSGDSYGVFTVTLHGAIGQSADFDYTVNTYHGDGAFAGYQAASVSAVPEPASLILLLPIPAALIRVRRRS